MSTLRSLFGRELPNILLTVFLVPLVIWSAVTTGGFSSWLNLQMTDGEYLTRDGLAALAENNDPGLGTIHFLNTASSDAILLESDGKFALIDTSESREAGEAGFGNYALDYVKRVAGGKLEFVMGTHAHSDHLGGMPKLLLDPEITVGRVYLKAANPESSLYQAVTQACEARDIPVLTENLNHSEFMLGNLKLKIFNGAPSRTIDENAESMCLLAESGGLRAFLAADMTWHYGHEDSVAKEIGGKLDLLKAGHHGYNGSNGWPYLARLQPKTAVYTNLYEQVTPQVKLRFTLVSNTTQMATSDFGGIAAVFGENEMRYFAIGEYPEG